VPRAALEQHAAVVHAYAYRAAGLHEFPVVVTAQARTPDVLDALDDFVLVVLRLGFGQRLEFLDARLLRSGVAAQLADFAVQSLVLGGEGDVRLLLRLEVLLHAVVFIQRHATAAEQRRHGQGDKGHSDLFHGYSRRVRKRSGVGARTGSTVLLDRQAATGPFSKNGKITCRRASRARGLPFPCRAPRLPGCGSRRVPGAPALPAFRPAGRRRCLPPALRPAWRLPL